MRLLVIVSTIAMWFFHKHHTKKSGTMTGDKVVDTNRVKLLSTEWEGVSNELAVVQQAFDAQQRAYNQALNNLAMQRCTLSCVYEELNELKMELGNYLRSNKIHVEKFKELSGDCIETYLTYESEQQKMTDMDMEFNNAYVDWEAKCEGRLSKIHSMREKIKTIEKEIQTLCSDI